jgi:predicted Fe-Mo cluster-binding NifX family protein
MKTAFSCWQNRIAPVFDVSREVYIVDISGGQIRWDRREPFRHDLPIQKAHALADRGIHSLVCGAISRPLHEMVIAYGIDVIPFIAGNLERIVQAWVSGRCDWNTFAMPGCRGQGRHRKGRTETTNREGKSMNKKGQGGKGSGRGKGQGGKGSGRGKEQGGRRSGGIVRGSGAGQTGTCICPQCGQQQAHQRGVPCFELTCPKCGSAMTRE